MNIGLARNVLNAVASWGVGEIVLCGGARNSPFVCLLEKCRGVKIFFHFDERAAAFFALGRILHHGRPVAVITTSGTAAAELLPATIEAHYAGLPLALITADRPKSYRGTGAPQTIEQEDLLRPFVEKAWDIDGDFSFSVDVRAARRPVHLNVCFDEPLVDEDIADWSWPEAGIRERPAGTASHPSEFNGRTPLVILGSLSAEEAPIVREALSVLRRPVYAEGPSGLRRDPLLREFSIFSGEEMAGRLLSRGVCDSVIRIGGVPTLRAWRDLEKKFASLPVLNLSGTGFSGLAREKSAFSVSAGLGFLLERGEFSEADCSWIEEDRRFHQRMTALFAEEKRSEPALFQDLSRTISPAARVYIGNSLPIREWDLAAVSAHRIFANRGANGIDGQLSTFIGLAGEGENWGIFGDLTALYDLSAPWMFSQLNSPCQIVIVNNRGGQIFSRLFKTPAFRNEHDNEFSHWAAMWKIPYLLWKEIPADFAANRTHVIELQPDPESTRRFWEKYDRMWGKA